MTPSQRLLSSRIRAFLVFVVCFSLSCASFSPLSSLRSRCQRAASTATTVLHATSSRELKEDERKRKKKKLKSRIARAAANAAALYPPERQSNQNNVKNSGGAVGNLQQLTHAIDEQLLQKQHDFTTPTQPQDSLSTLLGYNDEVVPSKDKTFEIAVVFGKPLKDDQVTVEYAARIQSLVELLMEKDNDIQLICFCGSTFPGNHIATADAGYLFFRHLAASHSVNLENVDIYIDRTSKDESTAIPKFVNHVRTNHLDDWLKEGKEESAVDEFGQNIKRKTIHIHFSLISTGYHLCNLNDVHHRSPGQSLLRYLESLRKEYSSTPRFDDWDDDDDDDDDTFEQSLNNRFQQKNEIVETSWSYRFARYPYLYAKDDAIAFMARCYLLGEELSPLYTNLKGVVNEKEFFQRDNYLVFASIRRSLVRQMEDLYETNPSLRSDLRQPGRDINVVLEGVVLSLGRCIDVVRPAGLLLGSVSREDYTKALQALNHAMTQVRKYCDPDAPLEPSEWGKLSEETTDTEAPERLYTQLDALRAEEEEILDEDEDVYS